MAWCGVVWRGVVWCDVVWRGVVWCGVVWCGKTVVILFDVPKLTFSLRNSMKVN